MITNIYDKLKEEGLNPYFIGQHKGHCEKAFAVISEGTLIPNVNSRTLGTKPISIILFVPAKSYIEVDPYAKSVRAALKELSYLRKTNTETPVIVDDDKKAYTMSIEYILQKKLEV